MIKKSALFYFFGWIILLIFSLFYFYNSNEYSQDTIYSIVLIFSLISFGIFILFSLINKERLFSLSMIFTLLMIIFHFGQLPIYIFNLDNILLIDVRFFVSDNPFILSLFYSFFIQHFFALGIISYSALSTINKKPTTQHLKNDNGFYITSRNFNYLVIFLFAIGFFPRIYIDINKYINFINGNYLDTFLEINGFIVTFSRFFNYSIIGFLLIYKNSRLKSLTIYLIFVFYSLFMMFTGSRSEPLINIIVASFVLINTSFKIKPNLFLAICSIVLLFFGASVLTYIATNRFADLTFGGLINSLDNFLIDNPLLAIIGELGGTQLSVAVPIKYSNVVFHGYGINYLISFLTIFPNVGGIFDNLFRNLFFTSLYRPFLNVGYGGSIIGELYYNFSFYGTIFSLFIGYFIGKISSLTIKYFDSGSYYKLFTSLVIFANVIWWIRDYFPAIVREIIWIFILIRIFENFNSKSTLRRRLIK